MDEQVWPKMKSECCEEANSDEVIEVWRLGGWENFVGKWKELAFDVLGYF